MGGTNLEPGLVIDVLRIALEVSLVLSDILGEEAVWVETSVDSIHVGSEDSGRGFTFWISPLKWLGGEFASRKLSSIAELGENLAGWKGKTVGDHAGYGLGGWLKWLRSNPDTGIREALEMLAASTGNEPPLPEPGALEQVTAKPVAAVKQPSSSAPFMIAAIAALLLVVGALAYFHRTVKAPPVPPQYAEQEISKPIAEPSRQPEAPVITRASAPVEKQAAPVRKQEDQAEIDVARVNALAKKLAEEAAAGKKKPARAAPAPAAAPRILAPGDVHAISSMQYGTRVKVRGVLRATNFSQSGLTLFFEFSEPRNKEQIRAVAYPSGYKGKLAKEHFANLIGKMVVIEGEVVTEPWNKWPMVKINSREQVTAGN
jgi:hypothetical protein